jgi:hypothetical protein
MFYLEDHYLKFGKVGKSISTSIDLRDAVVKLHKDGTKKFTITAKKTKLQLKADNDKQRSEWVSAIMRAKGGNGIIDDTLMLSFDGDTSTIR